MVFKCPNCGASLALESKESTGKCKFCGGTFAVPKRIIDLMWSEVEQQIAKSKSYL